MKYFISIALSLLIMSCATSRHDNFNQRKYFKHRLKSKPKKTTASNSSTQKTNPSPLLTKTEETEPSSTETVKTYQVEIVDTLPFKNTVSTNMTVPPSLSAIPLEDTTKKRNETNPMATIKFPIQPKLKSAPKTETPISKERRTFNTLFLTALFSFFGAWFVLILPVYLNIFSGVILISIGLVFIAWLLSIITLIQSKKVPQKDRDSLFRTQKFLLWLATVGIAATFGLGFLLLLSL